MTYTTISSNLSDGPFDQWSTSLTGSVDCLIVVVGIREIVLHNPGTSLVTATMHAMKVDIYM